jgi:hypothetical protein
MDETGVIVRDVWGPGISEGGFFSNKIPVVFVDTDTYFTFDNDVIAGLDPGNPSLCNFVVSRR